VKYLEDESGTIGVSVAVTTAGKLANQLKSLLSSTVNSLLLSEEQRVLKV